MFDITINCQKIGDYTTLKEAMEMAIQLGALDIGTIDVISTLTGEIIFSIESNGRVYVTESIKYVI